MMSGSSAGFRAGLVLSLAGLVIGVRAFFSPDCFRGACSVSGPLSGALLLDPPATDQDEAPAMPSSIEVTLKTLADAQDALFSLVVDEQGLVRYSLLQSDSALRAALDMLVSGYAEMPTPPPDKKNERLALWCNAYNVNVMNQVLVTGVPKRVLDVDGFFDKRPIRVGSQDLTLNDLENTQIRALGDPRVHAALNCAAVSCPILSPKAFRPEMIDSQLNDLCTAWVNDATRNRVDASAGTLYLSMIFKWFESDFKARPYGSVFGFVQSFAKDDSQIGAFVKNRPQPDRVPSIEFIEYDWTLNMAPEKKNNNNKKEDEGEVEEGSSSSDEG